jgi:hypothetical protein
MPELYKHLMRLEKMQITRHLEMSFYSAAVTSLELAMSPDRISGCFDSN